MKKIMHYTPKYYEEQQHSYMDERRREARQQMKVVALVLTCFAAMILGLAYHFLTRQ